MIERALEPHGDIWITVTVCGIGEHRSKAFQRLIGSLRKLDLLVTAEHEEAELVVLKGALGHVSLITERTETSWEVFCAKNICFLFKTLSRVLKLLL